MTDIHDLITPQPPPKFRPDSPNMHDLAAALHVARGEHGWGKYRSRLQVFNTRNAGVDGIQETLDHLVYELQRHLEAQALHEALTKWRTWAEQQAGSHQTVAKLLERYDQLTDPEKLTARADEMVNRMIAEAEH
jgi:hypothetical protein